MMNQKTIKNRQRQSVSYSKIVWVLVALPRGSFHIKSITLKPLVRTPKKFLHESMVFDAKDEMWTKNNFKDGVLAENDGARFLVVALFSEQFSLKSRP